MRTTSKQAGSVKSDLLSLVVGIAIGGFGVWFMTDTESEKVPPIKSTQAPVEAELTKAVKKSPAKAKLKGPAAKPEHAKLISKTLREHALKGIQSGWSAVRKDEMTEEFLTRAYTQFELNILDFPAQTGANLAQKLSDSQTWEFALEAGDGRTLLESADEKGEAPPFSFLEDDVIMDRIFQPRYEEKPITLVREPRKMAEMIVNGATIEFPAGVYDFRSFQLGLSQKKDVADLRIRGAGKDKTLLILSGPIMARGTLERLHIKDCTIHCNNNYLFQVYGGALTLHGENTRFVGFDMGAGGSCMVSAKHCLMYLKHCNIEGGYGRAYVGFGHLQDVRSAGLAGRFDDCLISHIAIGVHNQGNHVFNRCDLVELVDDERRFEFYKNLKRNNCDTTFYRRASRMDRKRKRVKKDLNDIFPRWKYTVISP